MTPANQIGTALKKIRQHRQMTQQELATKVHCSKTKIARIEQNQVILSEQTLLHICFALHVTMLDLYRFCFPKDSTREKIINDCRYAYEFPFTASIVQERMDQCELFLLKNPESEIIEWLYQMQQAELSLLNQRPLSTFFLDKILHISAYYDALTSWLPVDTVIVRTLLRIPGFYRHMPKLEETILFYADSEALGYYELAPIHFYIANQLIVQKKYLNAQFTMEKAWNAAKKARRSDIYTQATHVLTKHFNLEEFHQDILA